MEVNLRCEVAVPGFHMFVAIDEAQLTGNLRGNIREFAAFSQAHRQSSP